MPISSPYMPNPRLFATESLRSNAVITLDERRAHYLHNVLRLNEGAEIQLFNGQDGEWLSVMETVRKKTVTLKVQTLLRPHSASPDLWLVYAPLRSGKSEWVVEKATELGVSRLCPVLTQFTVAQSINATRLHSIAVEAAEQSERLDVPVIENLLPLTKCLGAWPQDRQLLYADESGQSAEAKKLLPSLTPGKYAVLIGPEGGFSAAEFDILRGLPYAQGLCMGPRILRADTAAIAALALIQAFCGDWEYKPAFRG